MQIHSIVATAVICLGGMTVRAQDNIPADLRRKVDRLAQPLIEGRQVVGMSIGLIQGDRVYTLHYGEAEAGTGRSANDRTVYEIGSVTKVFTGLLLADAALRGEVKLDDPVSRHLPELASSAIAGATLEDLVTHHSGLPRMPANFAPADAANPYADYTPRQMLDFLKSHKPDRAPGKSFDYSNLGSGLLGYILAQKAGGDYERLAVERIARPLKMTDTTMKLRDDQRRRLAKPYAAVGTPASNWDIATLSGAGAIRSTTLDMLRFAQLHLQAKAGDDNLSAAAATALQGRRDMGGGLKVGLAWLTARDGTTHFHNGQTGGYHSYIAVNPSRNIAVVILANTATMLIDPLGEGLVVTLAGGEAQPPKFDAPPPAVAVDRKLLEKYVGVYELVPGFALDVKLEGEQLTVQATNQQRFPVYAVSPREFVYRVVEAKITFDAPPAGGGPVKRLVLHQNGRQTPGTRK